MFFEYIEGKEKIRKLSFSSYFSYFFTSIMRNDLHSLHDVFGTFLENI